MPKSLFSRRHRKFLDLLVSARKAAGLSQRDLAGRLRIPYATIANIETGQRRVDVVEFIKLAELLGIRAEEVVKAVAGVKDKSVFGRRNRI